MTALTLVPGLYRHYKGGLYQVLYLARHSETEEQLVVYRSLAEGGVWVRPAAMFLEHVNGKLRFEHLPDAEAGVTGTVCAACNGAGTVAAASDPKE
jgi:hypothetical protein